MNPAWKTLLPAFLIGLLVGGFAGARCQRAAMHRFWQKGFDSERMLKKFDRELGLDAKQEEAVRAIVTRQREKVVAMHEETRARFDELRKAMRAEIEPLLTPEQKPRYEAMAARWDARRLKMKGPSR